MKKTIKTDDLVTVMTDLERKQGEAWLKSNEFREKGNDISGKAYNDYALGMGYCLEALEELLK